MPDFTSIADLLNYIEKTAVRAVQGQSSETSQRMIQTGEKHVQSDVYNVYSPKMYQRSGQLKEDWEITNTPNGVSLTNTRRDEETGKYIPAVIESGKGYTYKFPLDGVPRPFMQNTFIELETSGLLKDAVKRDLKKSGLNAE